MRFEQLKRKPNAILRKKLYKSGKSWVVASTLAFAGGMILLGSVPEVTVKADVGAALTESSESNTDNSGNSSDVKTETGNYDYGTNVDNDGSSQLNNLDNNNVSYDNKVTGNTSSANVGYSKPVPSSSAIPIQNASAYTLSTNQDPSQQQESINTDGSAPASTITDVNEGIDDPTNITSSKKAGNSNVGAGTDAVGSEWYINSQGVLHIGAGTWTDEGEKQEWAQTPFGGSSYAPSVNSLHFDGKVIAGKRIEFLFMFMNNLSDLGNMKDELDTSKTEDFRYLFNGDKSLNNYDFSTLNMNSATDVSYMFCNTGIQNINLSGFDWPNITDYTSMFNTTGNLDTADLSGFNFHNSSMEQMFSSSAIKNIILKNVDVSNVTNMFDLFTNDSALVSLDLSYFKPKSDISSNSFLVLGDHPKLNSLTLNPTFSLSQSALDFDHDAYKGWKNKDNPNQFKYPMTSYELTTLYSTVDGNIPPAGIQTWVLVDKDKVDYTINYFTSDQDQKTDTPFHTEKDSGIDGSTKYFKVLDGYTAPNPGSVTLDCTNGANQVFNVVVDKLVPYNLNINVHYEDDPTKDTSTSVALQMNQTDVTKDAGFQSDLDKLPNSNKTLDWDKTTINLGKLSNGGYDLETIGDIAEWNSLPHDMTSLKDIINTFINFNINNNGNPLTGLPDGNVDDFLDAYYKTYEAPTDNSHHSGGSSTSTTKPDTKPSGEISDIKQTVATFDNHSQVQLYDSEGNAVANEYLDPNTSWYNDKKMDLDGTTYYRVSTDKWINANDVYIYTTKNTHVRVYNNNYGDIVDARGKVLNRALKPSTDWYSDRVVEINGNKYYRVATNEFVKAENVYGYDYDSPVITTNKVTPVYDERGNATETQLPTNSSYKTDRYEMINGEKYYRIASDEFVKAEDVNL